MIVQTTNPNLIFPAFCKTYFSDIWIQAWQNNDFPLIWETLIGIIPFLNGEWRTKWRDGNEKENRLRHLRHQYR